MAVTVYELIQELSKYKADTEVRFHVDDVFPISAKPESDRKIESGKINLSVNSIYNDYYVRFRGMRNDGDEITIDLKY